MGIFKKLVGTIAEKFLDTKAEDFITELSGKYKDTRIEKDIKNFLLDKYGSEIYFNDLDSFIMNNHLLENLIDSLHGRPSVQPISKKGFVIKNLKLFLNLFPGYKKKKVLCSKIKMSFENLYDYVVLNINKLNPYSDVGILQNDMHRMSAEMKFDQDKIFVATAETNENVKKLLDLISPQQSVVETASQDLFDYSETSSKYISKIKKIESEFQCKHLYREALELYFELFREISIDFSGKSHPQINQMICSLNCNIALCQYNLGEEEKALLSLSKIEKNAAKDSKTFHFVSAAFIIQSLNSEKYNIAKEHLEHALELDPKYHRAFLLKKYLQAIMSATNLTNCISELDDFFSDIISEEKDKVLIAEYYMHRGLIRQNLNDPYAASDDFIKAYEYGYDPLISKYNLALAYYGQSIEGFPKGIRLFAPQIKYQPMIKSIEILEEIIFDERVNEQQNALIKNRSISVYVSACQLLGVDHKLDISNDLLKTVEDYETLRGILLGGKNELTDEEIGFLDSSDKLYYEIKCLLESESFEKVEQLLSGIIESPDGVLTEPNWHILLQVSLILKNPDKYWKYKKQAVETNNFEMDFTAMDACAFELEGQKEKAKDLFDEIAQNSLHYHDLSNCLRFYRRNNFVEETIVLYLRIHELSNNKYVFIEDIDNFYGEAISYLVNNHYTDVKKILEDILPIVSRVVFLRLQQTYYSSQNDIPKLNDCFSEIIQLSDEFSDWFNKALCLRWLFRYDEALDFCQQLMAKNISKEEKTKLYWLMSDLHLFKNNLKQSFEYALNAHELNKENPYEQSHQALLARSMRCNRFEALQTVSDFQKTHPVVVDWFKTIQIKEDEDFIETLKDNLPNNDDYLATENNIARLYRTGNVPMNLIRNRYHSWGSFFEFARQNKLFICTGIIDELKEEQELIAEDVVVDEQTLVIMAHYGCLEALNKIKYIHINYGSIVDLLIDYQKYDFQFAEKALNWIHEAKNIVFEPDGYVEENSEITKAFSRNFTACCNIAKRANIPFLFSDYVAKKFQKISGLGLPCDVNFVSIPAACRHMDKDGLSDELNEMLYSLLKNCTFVSFNSSTIMYVIKNNNYTVTKDLLSPFFICKPEYDLNSFASVYLHTIILLLNKEKPDLAVSFTELVLDDLIRVWKKGTRYRYLAKRLLNKEAEIVAENIKKYVEKTLGAIINIYTVLPEELIPYYQKIKSYLDADQK
ncbi:MAG: hypothetical protein IJO36_06665 [Clostridia bacterium]|nr:hypothetical protein [Clostridia bacterium]